MAPVLPKLVVAFAPLMLTQIFAVEIARGGRSLAGAPFAFVSLALLLAARATRSTSTSTA